MTDLHHLMAHNKIAQTWTPEIQREYHIFHDRLSGDVPLSIKIGKGGLSFYKATGTESVFICHFNAEPRKGQREIGFADFRYDALREYLNVETVIQDLQQAAPSQVHIKINKLWCSLHFPLELSAQVAELLREHIIKQVD